MTELKALQKVSYGLYVVSSRLGEKLNGQMANTVFQVTAEPAKIAVCINKQNLTHQYISESGLFSVSILSRETPMLFVGKFGFKSGRENDKFKDTGYKMLGTGCPAVTEFAVGIISAKVTGQFDVGTHTLFAGEVVESEVLSEKEPMTYEYYHKHLKGKEPKTAPTYQKQEG